MIPCKENKCLKYPSCINKEEIHCRSLFNWLSHRGHTEETWKHMRKFLKSIQTIKADKAWFNDDHEWPYRHYINQEKQIRLSSKDPITYNRTET